MTQKKQDLLNWYQNEVIKDQSEIRKYKNQMIDELKKTNKEKIFYKEKIKLTLWQRIKKVLMGF